jgi:hypothetical protein
MAYFAQLNDENIIEQVIAISNDVVPDPAPDNEQLGIDYIVNTLGLAGTWLQTSYHGKFRYNYAAVGGTYDANADAFIGPKPYESWIINETNYTWEAPVPRPTEPGVYYWNESTQSWESFDE